MRRSDMRRLSTAVTLTILLAAAAGNGQEPVAAVPNDEADSGPEELFLESVDVKVVNVHVLVTDRDGNPITGLTEDDFQILEDGRPVAMTNFYAVEAGERRNAGAGLEESGEGSPEAAAAQLPLIEDEPDRLRLVILVDNVNIEAVHRNRVFRDLRRFLVEKLAPDDEVMLLSYERSLKVKQPFTNDPQIVARQLFELESLSSNSTQAGHERFELLRQIEESTDPARVERYIRNYAQSSQNDLNFTLRAIRELVRSLAGLPGRKALLYVSDGLPMTPGEEMYIALTHRYPRQASLIDAREFDASRSFRELANLANSNRVSFYTLDAAGVRLSMAGDVERGGSSAGLVSAFDAAFTNNVQNPLRYLAGTTGGRAILNTNNPFTALERLATDADNYYSLGYTPSHSGDGRYHRIEVKVARKGVEVRHREGYRDKPVFDRMADGVESVLRWGRGANPLAFRLKFDAAAASEDGEVVVPMIVEIPLGKMVLLPKGEKRTGRITIFVAANDAKGRRAPVQQVPVTISIPAAGREGEEPESAFYRYTIPMRMRPGRQRIAVGVRDELGAVEGFAVSSVDVAG